MSQFLIYGANGYTGELITRVAVERGSKPIIAGRNEEAIKALAEQHGLEHRVFTLDDTAKLDAALKELPDCRLIIIDPIGSFLGGSTDLYRDNEVRAVLAPVAQLAEKYGVAVLVVAHVRKALSQHADDMAMGSRAFTGIARAVWHLSRDLNDKNRRLLLPGKRNLTEQPAGLAFTIAGDPPALCWERDPVEQTADDRAAEAIFAGVWETAVNHAAIEE